MVCMQHHFALNIIISMVNAYLMSHQVVVALDKTVLTVNPSSPTDDVSM